MKLRSIRTMALGILIPTILAAMVVLSLLGYSAARKTIQESINSEMELCLSTAKENIEKSLSNNRKVVETLAQAVEAAVGKFDEDAYGNLLTSFIETNDETFGGGIWFEPYAFDPLIKYVSPYCMRENGKVVYVDNYSLGDGVYYTDQDWYTNVINTNESAVWSAPYFDDYVKISMVTSSAPFYDSKGNFMGVATTDIDLTQLQKMIASLQVHESGRAFLIDETGTYIADEDNKKLLAANITSDANTSLAALGKKIIAEKNGSGSYSIDGNKQLVWFSEVPESGWIIVTTISESALMSGITSLGSQLLFFGFIFALLACIIVILFVRFGITRPLQQLTKATHEIADGNLDVSIQVKSKNEIGDVANSLKKTVCRLQDYIAYIQEVSQVLDSIADGNLNFQLQCEYKGDFSKLKKSLLHIQKKLSGTLENITESAKDVSNSSDTISEAAKQLSSGSVEQSGSMEEISGNVQEMLSSIENNSKQLLEAKDMSAEILNEIHLSDQMMKEMTDAMAEISRYSGEIGKIIKTVEDIAFQTNILALNAAVEAARAGVAGKGFAVVADEVRNLANKSQEAVNHTASLIENSLAAINNGSQIAVDTASSMAGVVDSVEATSKIIQAVSEKYNDQVQAIAVINREIDKVASVVENNSAMAQESAAKSEELMMQSKRLYEAASQFHR